MIETTIRFKRNEGTFNLWRFEREIIMTKFAYRFLRKC